MTLHGVSIVDNRLFHHDIRGHENSVDEEASRRVDVMFNLLSTALSDIGPLGRCIIAPLKEMPLSKPMPCSDTKIEDRFRIYWKFRVGQGVLAAIDDLYAVTLGLSSMAIAMVGDYVFRCAVCRPARTQKTKLHLLQWIISAGTRLLPSPAAIPNPHLPKQATTVRRLKDSRSC